MTFAPQALVARLGPAIILPVAVAALGLWGFAGLLDEVSEGDASGFDSAVLLFFRTPGNLDQPIGPWWLNVMVGDLTALGSMSVLGFITLAVAGYLALTRRLGGAVLIVAAVAGGFGLSSLLKIGIDRPRPDLVGALAEVHTLSFPSGHAMLSAVTYLTLGTLLASMMRQRRSQVYVMVLALVTTVLVGMTRIYLGVHWPTDVLAGWCAGAAWAMLCWLVRELILRRSGRLTPSQKAGPADST